MRNIHTTAMFLLPLLGCTGDITLVKSGAECGEGTIEVDGVCVPDPSDSDAPPAATDTDGPLDTDAPPPTDTDTPPASETDAPADLETDESDTTPQDSDTDGVEAGEDCDDNDPLLGATADDADCDGVLTPDDCDDDDPQVGAATTWWIDADGDGHGTSGGSMDACDQPSGYAPLADDCDDTDDTIWTGCLTQTCGGAGPGLGVYNAPTSYSPELHIVAVYEPHPGSTITVENDRPGEIILVLNAYEPVDWIITNTGGGTIGQIAVTGYNNSLSTVSGPAAAGVTVIREYWAACSYQWPSDTGGCDTPGLVSAAEARYTTTLQSWRGCYGGENFVVD